MKMNKVIEPLMGLIVFLVAIVVFGFLLFNVGLLFYNFISDLNEEKFDCMDKCNQIGEFKSYKDGLCRCILQDIVELKDLEKPIEIRTHADCSLKIMHGDVERLLSGTHENFSLTLEKNNELDDTDVLYYEVNK